MKYNNNSHSERSLDEWLCFLENIHHSEIDMGLERISVIAERLAIDLSFAKVITVAGTNGKGTTCAFLENVLLAKNKTVAVYSSPHIDKFNERLRVNKQDIDDQSLINAFNQIEQSRADVSLTYYEYTTLAAFLVMMNVRPDIIILEVGLGGRLDATNIIDADIAVITTVDLDHQIFLGNDRESIGFEKAGIMRESQLVVVGDNQPPDSVLNHANKLNTELHLRNRDFDIVQNKMAGTWQWQHNETNFSHLPEPHIPVDNIATALMVLVLLNTNISNDMLKKVIRETKVSGRTEMLVDNCQVMLDVGHNPLAARYLADRIAKLKVNKVHAVVGMLADKDIYNTLTPLLGHIDQWYAASLDVPRGANASQLVEYITETPNKALFFDNAVDGYKMAQQHAKKDDLILVFGSFFTVAQVRAYLNITG